MKQLQDHKTAILLGEIGAFLHMFGKCSEDFLGSYTINGKLYTDTHQDLKNLPKTSPFLSHENLKNQFKFNNEPSNVIFSDFITKYKGTDHEDCTLLKLFNNCHRITSADEKGVIRRKQKQDAINISTPFGFDIKKLNLDEVETLKFKMDEDLSKAFDLYVNEKLSIECFRSTVKNILEPGMRQTLGETRRPANDITLWDQTWGVATLYKSALAGLILKKENIHNTKWRLFGIGWNGDLFITKGKKPADILDRQNSLTEIRKKIISLLELEYPLGNLFYWDNNGLFFTFPNITGSEIKNLLSPVLEEIITNVHTESKNELWPFFTLSNETKSMTIVTKEIETRNKQTRLPKSHYVLIESDKKQSIIPISIPKKSNHNKLYEVCPICHEKPTETNVTKELICDICTNRRKNRLKSWLKNSNKETIWIDEIADTNNRIALINLQFDISKWLNGTWFKTILSQTFDDWASINNPNLFDNQNIKEFFKNLITNNKINDFRKGDSYDNALSVATLVNKETNKKAILKSFMEDGKIENVDVKITEIKDGYSTLAFEQAILCYYFTQNPSPGRLSRIWNETETFFKKWDVQLNNYLKSTRIKIKMSTDNFDYFEDEKTYIMNIKYLSEPITIYCEKAQTGQFITIDSMQSLKINKEFKIDFIIKTLTTNKDVLLQEENNPNSNIITCTISEATKTNSYISAITLTSSPISKQVLVPANKLPIIMTGLCRLYNTLFSKVFGKLPLNLNAIIANQKMPLYVLLEASHHQITDTTNDFQKLSPWWDTNINTDDFFGNYSTKKTDDTSFTLSDLKHPTKNDAIYLTPGKTRWLYLGSSTDRFKTGTCINTHELEDIEKLWNSLTQISTRQRHIIEAQLNEAKQRWNCQSNDEIYRKFALAVLKKAFGETLWHTYKNILKKHIGTDLILHTLELTHHILKLTTDKDKKMTNIEKIKGDDND